MGVGPDGSLNNHHPERQTDRQTKPSGLHLFSSFLQSPGSPSPSSLSWKSKTSFWFPRCFLHCPFPKPPFSVPELPSMNPAPRGPHKGHLCPISILLLCFARVAALPEHLPCHVARGILLILRNPTSSTTSLVAPVYSSFSQSTQLSATDGVTSRPCCHAGPCAALLPSTRTPPGAVHPLQRSYTTAPPAYSRGHTEYSVGADFSFSLHVLQWDLRHDSGGCPQPTRER